jgi:hypothetical protein
MLGPIERANRVLVSLPSLENGMDLVSEMFHFLVFRILDYEQNPDTQ